MIALQFKPEHLDLVEELNEHDHEVTKDGLIEVHNAICKDSVMLSIIDDGRIVCICGIRYMWESVGEAFNIRTSNMKPLHIRFVKKQFDERMEFYDRIQTHSKADMWEKWHTMLGFKKEVVLKKYHKGEDKILWVRFN